MKNVKPNKLDFKHYIFFCSIFLFVSCSKPEVNGNEPTPTAPTLTITPGTTLSIPYNNSVTFSWVTNGSRVTVNGIQQTNGSFSSPLLQTNTVYNVTSYSADYVNSGLSTTVQVNVTVGQIPVDIHVAGFNNGYIVYWKNGIEKTLSATTAGIGHAYGIAVSDTNVYIVGYHGSPSYAVYWKNGTRVNLTNGTNGANATSVTTSGNDVYIGGYQSAANSNNAVYWKNGVQTILFKGLASVSVTAMAVSGGDIYATGFIDDTAVIWKNGVRTTLTYGYAGANAIAISGTDVYVAGTENGKSVYWKNGVKTILECIAPSQAYAISVSESDVYVAGRENTNKACYWKNGLKTSLSTSNSNANSMSILNGDVYICGWISNGSFSAVVWKNGVASVLAANAPGIDVEANAIVVKSR